MEILLTKKIPRKRIPSDKEESGEDFHFNQGDSSEKSLVEIKDSREEFLVTDPILERTSFLQNGFQRMRGFPSNRKDSRADFLREMEDSREELFFTKRIIE